MSKYGITKNLPCRTKGRRTEFLEADYCTTRPESLLRIRSSLRRSSSSCSQTRNTTIPSDRSLRLICAARRMLPPIFVRQYDRLPRGSRRQRLHPCQKHPSTNKAIRFVANQKSGRPGTDSGCSSHPEILARTRASRSRTSVERLPRERTFAINALRSVFESVSILKSRMYIHIR
jgi:hypothetical protein